MPSLTPPGAGLGMCPKDLPVPLAPSFSRQLVPFAAAILHHSRLLPLVYLGALLVPNRCRLSQRCLLYFPSAKWVLTSAVNSTNVSNNSVTITETGSQ